MPRRMGFQLARVFGIKISVRVSWLVMLFISIIFFTPLFHEVLGGSSQTAYLVTVVSVLSLFVSLVVHELGHALVAKRHGIRVEGIELWALGGITRTESTGRSPGEQLKIAGAGPLATLLVLAACAAGGALAVPHEHLLSFTVGAGGHTTAVEVWLKTVTILNVFVFVLNMVPAFPLDGGQIAQALIWWRSGDQNLATRVTGRLGQALAMVIAGAGVYMLAQGIPEGIYLAAVALFIYQGAGAAVIKGSLGQRIQKLTVADVMDREPITIQGDETVLSALERYFAPYQWPWFAVVDAERRFLGVVTRKRVEGELAAGRPALTAAEAIEEDVPVRIREGQPLETVLSSEALLRIGGMVVLDRDGTLQGVVTLAQIRRALRPVS